MRDQPNTQNDAITFMLLAMQQHRQSCGGAVLGTSPSCWDVVIRVISPRHGTSDVVSWGALCLT